MDGRKRRFFSCLCGRERTRLPIGSAKITSASAEGDTGPEHAAAWARIRTHCVCGTAGGRAGNGGDYCPTLRVMASGARPFSGVFCGLMNQGRHPRPGGIYNGAVLATRMSGLDDGDWAAGAPLISCWRPRGAAWSEAQVNLGRRSCALRW